MGCRRRERQTRVGSQAESHGGWLHPDSTGATGCICPHLRPGDWAFIMCTPSHSWARVTLRHLLLPGKTGGADVGQGQTSDGSHWDRTVDRHTQTRGDWAECWPCLPEPYLWSLPTAGTLTSFFFQSTWHLFPGVPLGHLRASWYMTSQQLGFFHNSFYSL